MDKEEIKAVLDKKSSTVVTDATVLSDAEKEDIKARVEKKLAAEKRKKLADDYEASLIAEAKKKALFSNAKPGTNADGLVAVFIDLPSVTECIRLDGRQFYPGRTYHVSTEVAEVLHETMGRGQDHEDEVSGRKDSNRMRKKAPLVARI